MDNTKKTGIAKRPIRLIGVRQNNLKSISVEFPARQISVVTGLSGSGKSSLVFDTLYAEGQRRYVESLSTYTRQFLEKMPKPDVDRVENIPPAIALEQKNHIVNSRSTVGTQTEIVDYLRVLFAKVGRTYCVDCGSEVKRLDSGVILDWAKEWLPNRKALILAPLTLPERPVESAKEAKKAKVASSKKSVAKKPAAKKSDKKAPGKVSDLGSSASGHSSQGYSAETLLQIIKEQGFSRVYAREKDSLAGEVYDIEDLEALPNALEKLDGRDLYVVVDRLRLSTENLAEEDEGGTHRARVLDAIDQSLAIGKNRVAFVDMEDAKAWRLFDVRYACVNCGREHRVPEPNLFSFNSPIGACPNCSGFGHNLELDETLVVPDPTKTIKGGALDPFTKPSFSEWQKDLFRFAERQGIALTKRYSELTPVQRKSLWNGVPGDTSFPGVFGVFKDLAKYKYKLHIRVFIRRYQTQSVCPICHGARLTPDALAVKIESRAAGNAGGRKNIAEILDLPIEDGLIWIRDLALTKREEKIGTELLSQVIRRFSFLEEVGVGYLTLSRLARSLSGGEFQRINLATQLGNGLCGTLYILDEPSIGLHASDTNRLITVLKRLRDQGNSVVVVEHDLEVMKAADWLVELGPKAGRNGGSLVAQGTAATLALDSTSVTGKYISGEKRIERVRPIRGEAKRWLKFIGCRENNLREIDVEIPLDRLVVVSGVSGSGKSTLVHKTIYNALAKHFYHATDPVGKFERLYGADQLQGVVMLDQSPIGRSSRSNPATYLKAWDEVRRIFANQSLSLRRGYTTQHFSFNVDGGRCPVCKGEGEVTLDMHFMAEVKLPCEECGGKRFKKSVLDVTYRGKDVYGLLSTTIDEAYELFRDNSILSRKFGILRDVGLGYLQVGQSGTTLSGGESQRLKIAATLDDRQNENLLYIFDEPTTGLHLDDVKRLISVIQDLVDSRHSVIMIEHHLDVIAQADWLIDIGPGGGKRGGELIAAGRPDVLILDPKSVTGETLAAGGYSEILAHPPRS
ncbi:MAG: excinuclease ABC subunit UvrA [Cryobacterium sp.]|nr:excinuclease ABC subunit UvrA [Oligoflexia bacterium]